jgi:hypothetical protein
MDPRNSYNSDRNNRRELRSEYAANRELAKTKNSRKDSLNQCLFEMAQGLDKRTWK